MRGPQAARRAADTQAEIDRIRTAAEVAAVAAREETGRTYARNPALLRLEELTTLRELAKSANARIYIGFDKHAALEPDEADGRSRPKD